jgi:hypothetical protein
VRRGPSTSQCIDWVFVRDYHYVRQEVQVPPEAAGQVLALVKAKKPVDLAMCINATADLLRQLPGFEFLGSTFFP